MFTWMAHVSVTCNSLYHMHVEQAKPCVARGVFASKKQIIIGVLSPTDNSPILSWPAQPTGTF